MESHGWVLTAILRFSLTSEIVLCKRNQAISLGNVLLSTRKEKRILNCPRTSENPVTLKRWRAGFFVLTVPKAIAFFR